MTTAATAPIRNIWQKSGLDLTDSAFSKVHSYEIRFTEKDDSGDSLKKFELDELRFEEFRTLLDKKQNRMAMKTLLQVTENNEILELIDQAQLIQKATMIAHRDSIWNATVDLANQAQAQVNAIYDKQLKCNVFGNWILEALTSSALSKLESTKVEWAVEKDGEMQVHGPILFWHIVDLVKPNNDTLVQNAKEELVSLNVKNFDHSIKSMLVKFENIITHIKVRLKGEITNDEIISALWKTTETMQDEHFSKVVSDEKRLYRRATAANKKSYSDLIADFKREETDLRGDGKWNKSNKDAQIRLLTATIEGVIKHVNNLKSFNTNQTRGSGGKVEKESKKVDIAKDNVKKASNGTPEWKYLRKNEDEYERTVDGKEYWWCPKHRNPVTGKSGMWSRHRAEEHTDNFTPQNSNSSTKKDDSKQAENKATEGADSNQTSIQVDRKLFSALKSGADVQSFLSKLEHNGTSLN